MAILAVLFDLRPCSHGDRAPAGVIAPPDAGRPADDAPSGKIGTGNDFQQLVDRHVRLIDDADQCVANLAQVMGWDRRGHAHRDAVGPVDQEVGELRRQDRGLQSLLVVGRNEVDRVELQVLQQRRGDGRHAGFGVSHGCGRQTGDRAEVSLLVDQHVAQVPFLGHANQRGIDHTFAVRMVITAGVAGDLRALHPGCPRRQAQVVHCHQDASLRRL